VLKVIASQREGGKAVPDQADGPIANRRVAGSENLPRSAKPIRNPAAARALGKWSHAPTIKRFPVRDESQTDEH